MKSLANNKLPCEKLNRILPPVLGSFQHLRFMNSLNALICYPPQKTKFTALLKEQAIFRAGFSRPPEEGNSA